VSFIDGFVILFLLLISSVVGDHGFLSYVMRFLSWFYVEAKAFELSVAEGVSILRLVERS